MYGLLKLLQRIDQTDPKKERKIGLIPVANTVQQVAGDLPKQERQEIEDIFRRVRKLP